MTLPSEVTFADLLAARLRDAQYYQRDEFPASAEGRGEIAAIDLEADGTTPVDPPEIYVGKTDGSWAQIGAASSPSTPAIIAARASSTSTFTYGGASTFTVTFAEDFDTSSMFASNQFTAPQTGLYHFYANYDLQTNFLGVSSYTELIYVYVNSSAVFTRQIISYGIAMQRYNIQISLDLNLTAGDTVDLRVRGSTADDSQIYNRVMGLRYLGELAT